MATNWFDLLSETRGPRWHLDGPFDAKGTILDLSIFLDPARINAMFASGVFLQVRNADHPLDFSFATWGIPIVRTSVLSALRRDIGTSDFVQIPATIPGVPDGEFAAMATTQLIPSFDFVRSEYDLSPPDAHGNRKLRMPGRRWRVDGTLVPESTNVFRVAEWYAAVIVSKKVRSLLLDLRVSGATFVPR